jgi:hypothetical protein
MTKHHQLQWEMEKKSIVMWADRGLSDALLFFSGVTIGDSICGHNGTHDSAR